MMYTYPTQTTFIYLIFSFTFFSSTCFFSIPIKYLFISSTHHRISSSAILLHPKDSSSSSLKRQEERNILYTKYIYIYIYIWEEEEACISCGFMGLCWNWILHIWFRILQSVWLVRSWRKWKERRTITTCTVRFFFWASCNWGGGSIECREILLLHDFFFNEILVKLGFQNKNKGSLGIMLKMTSGNMISIFAFSTL